MKEGKESKRADDDRSRQGATRSAEEMKRKQREGC